MAAERLHGGLDLAATLSAGRPVEERGLLAMAEGGVITLPMAERAGGPVVAALLGMLDGGGGTTLLALDESMADEDPVAAALRERLPFMLRLDDHGARCTATSGPRCRSWPRRATRLPHVTVGEEAMRSICHTAMALGVGSSRADVLTVRAARANAALEGRTDVSEADVSVACALVLAPRATRLPDVPPEPPAPSPEENDPAPDDR